MPKINLFITRHGETDWNKQNLFQGQTDIPLNETGLEQAEALATKLKDQHFDVCFCSPLTRAKQTAEAIQKYHPDLQVIEEPLLLERAMGEHEGTPAGDGRTAKDHYLDTRLNVCTHGMESIQDILKRGQAFIDKIKNLPYQNILVVCHGYISKGIHYSNVGWEQNSILTDWWIENCEVKQEIIDFKKDFDIYLDMDGVLRKVASPREDIETFLNYCMDNHPTYWLTSHCRDGYNHIERAFKGYVSDTVLTKVLNTIQPTDWNLKKTEAINFNRPFFWFDDNAFTDEMNLLEARGAKSSFFLAEPHNPDNAKQMLAFIKNQE